MLFEQLEQIRKDGFALVQGESELGMSAIGVPIFNYEKRPVAAAVLIAPTHRITPNATFSIAEKMKEAAKILSADFYYHQS